MPEPTDVEVAALASVITEAKLSGVSASSWTLARKVLDAGYRYVDPTEAHVIELRDDGWTLSHPLACRAGGVDGLFECEVNRAASAQLTGPLLSPGRYRVVLDDGQIVFDGRLEATDG